MKAWLIALVLLAASITGLQAEVRIVHVDPLKDQLELSATQLEHFLSAYRDYASKRKSAVRRARLKARGSDDAARRVKKALKKTNARFDEQIETILEDAQFTLYLASRDLLVSQLARRRTGFSDASIPNPGGLLAGQGGGN